MQTVDRILMLIDLLSSKKGGYMISEISEYLDLPISTIHRLLSSLKEHGYVIQDYETKKYRLGFKILQLGDNLLNNIDVRLVARTYMEKLCQKYREVAFLTIMENNRMVCIDTEIPSEKVRYFVKIGAEMPVNASASAQAILAYRDEIIIDMVINGKEFIKYTPNTLINNEEIKNKLKEIKSKGYAICDEELELGVKAIAAPIRDYTRKIIASITLLYIKSKNFNEEKKIKDVQDTALEISTAMGYRK